MRRGDPLMARPPRRARSAPRPGRGRASRRRRISTALVSPTTSTECAALARATRAPGRLRAAIPAAIDDDPLAPLAQLERQRAGMRLARRSRAAAACRYRRAPGSARPAGAETRNAAPAIGAWPRVSDRVSDEVDEDAVLLDRIVEQREPAVAMAEKPQHRRHPLDRLLQRAGTSSCAARKAARGCRSGRAAPCSCTEGLRRAVAAIGQDLDRAARVRARAAPARCAFPSRPARQARRSAPSARAAAPRRPVPRRRCAPGGAPAGRCSPASRGAARGRSRGRRSPRNARSRRRSASPATSERQAIGCQAGILGEPALHQSARRVARRRADADQVGEPAEPVPGGEPFRPGARRKPHRRSGCAPARRQNSMSPARIASPRFGVARPALVELEPQIGRHAADQRMAIERPGGERAPSVAPQPGEQIGHLRRRRRRAAARAPRRGSERISSGAAPGVSRCRPAPATAARQPCSGPASRTCRSVASHGRLAGGAIHRAS